MTQGGFRPRPRVRWLAPTVLARSVRPVILSGLFARFSDRREVEAVLAQSTVVDLSGEDEVWVDYVADTGDGFDATATVASLLAPEALTVDGHQTRAGALLVLGGDEVYPYASQQDYQDRLIGPFRAMLPCSDPERQVVAVPGNHDWYDGLSAFLQVFCGRQWIGGWKTVQRRSYFACKLPNRWWLWGIDIQLDTYIDHPQIEYFKAEAAKVQPGDGIILCWAKPSWVEAGEDTPQAYDTLDFFQRTVVPDHAHLRLSLTGDSHHYARYEGPEGEHKITAGLGGAFLSATHHLPPRLQLPAQVRGDPPITFVRRAEYPSCAQSRRRRWSVLNAMHANDRFALLPACAYGGLALGLTRSRGRIGATAAVAAAMTAGCVGFSKPKKLSDCWIGVAHGAGHVAAALAATRLARSTGGRRPAVVAGAAATGATVGPLLFGLYLVGADRIGLFGRNTNELFAAQAIEDHKGFLRLHFRRDGGLTIYPVKVDRVSCWVGDGEWGLPPGAPRFRPLAPPAPSLIEPPVEVTRTP